MKDNSSIFNQFNAEIFGRFDAESDSSLNNYFVKTGAADRVASGKSLVLGRKGSGKTALFMHMKAMTDQTIVDLDLQDYLFAVHAKLRNTEVRDSFSYTAAWKLLIYLSALGTVSKKLNGSDKITFKRILNDLKVGDENRPEGKLFSWLKRVKRIDFPSISIEGGFGGGGIEFGDSNSDCHDPHRFTGYITQLEDLAEDILKKYPVSVIIDRVDDVWDGSAEASQMISGVLKATRDINLKIPRAAGVPATAILFLRTDLWSIVRFNDRNKMSQDIERLSWKEEDLTRVVEERIRVSTGENTLSWFDVFYAGEMRQRAKSQSYIMKRTMAKPRDVLAFCFYSLEVAVAAEHKTVLKSDIYEAEYKYSQHMLDELVDEIYSYDFDSNHVLNALRKIGNRNFRLNEWEQATDRVGMTPQQADSALTKLFEASAIGVYNRGGAGGGSKTIYKYQNDLLTPPSVDEIMQVHPSFTKALNLREPKTTAN